MSKDTIRSLADWWVRTWNEHCYWMDEKIPDKQYAWFMRSALQTLRVRMETALGVDILDEAFAFKPEHCPCCGKRKGKKIKKRRIIDE